MASVGDKTADGSVNGDFFIFCRISAINVLKMFSNIILVFFLFQSFQYVPYITHLIRS